MGIAARCLHGAGLCVIPKPENDHRPLSLRHGPLAFTSALLITAKVMAVAIIALTPASADLSTITTNRIIQLTNAERKKAGLNELQVSSLLSSAAAQKGQDMLEHDYFAHISPTGVTPWFWMSKVGYTYQVAGENLAIDFTEAEDVVAAWLASPTHKDNMLHPEYTQTGVAVVTGEFEGGTSTIVVHMFGLPAAAEEPLPALTTTPQVTTSTTGAATPTPHPSPTPSTATPVPAKPPTPPDTTPPRVPRIASLPTSLVHASLQLKLEGEAGSLAHILLNNQLRANVAFNAAGEAQQEVSTNDLPDGVLTVRAYATDPAGNTSDISTPLAVTKDTVGPELARNQVAFLISPASDSPQAVISLPTAAATSITLEQASQPQVFAATEPITTQALKPFVLSLTDKAGNTTTLPSVTLRPSYSVDNDTSYVHQPARFSQLTRRLSMSIFAALLILLVLAVIIRIRVQRPLMIAHASLVLFLAALFFIW